MKIAPVRKYAKPRFPTRTILDEHPEMLRLVPERWQHNPAVLAALAGICMLMLSSKELGAAADRSKSRVAPIFQHGDGRASFGCVAINPPVFLSEAEARQVIIEEGRKSGLTFTSKAPTVRRVNTPITDRNASHNYAPGARNPKLKTRAIPLKLDGTDRKRHISYEYVSESDFNAWEHMGRFSSTVYSLDILETAEGLRDGLKRARPSGSYAVFYDPMYRPALAALRMGRNNPPEMQRMMKNKPEPDPKAMRVWREADAKNAARNELRKQVKDFIIWLKSQGVI